MALDHFFFVENNANYNTIQYCTFDLMRKYTDWAGSRIWGNSAHNKFIFNTISRYGDYTNGSDNGTLVAIGLWSASTDHSDYNLIENNTFYSGGHDLLEVNSKYNVIRNNYLHHENWKTCSRPGGVCGNRNAIRLYV